ncbi:MAG: hypothetical protein K0R51_2798 [Cytophagaceae bacterium]|jgi:hypothetical protein|nr:hypothetical protein [Cytophagaceae bacterium]
MKNRFLLSLALFAFFCLVAISCKENKNEEPAPGKTAKAAYEKKWDIQSSTQRIASSVDSTSIASIEFNKNTYIIILTDNTIITGTFTENNAELILTHYGTIIISQLSNTNFSFAVTRNNHTVSFTSSPAPLMTSTHREPTFYKTWKFVNHTSDWAEIDSAYSRIDELYVTFSAYGTYLVQTKYKNGYNNNANSSATTDGTYYYDVNTWKWSDDTHSVFCYGEWDRTNNVVCDNSNQVGVIFIDDETIQFKTEGIRQDTTYRVIYDAILQH